MKAYGETQVLEVDDYFDETGTLKFKIEGIHVWVSWAEVTELRDHLNRALAA